MKSSPFIAYWRNLNNTLEGLGLPLAAAGEALECFKRYGKGPYGYNEGIDSPSAIVV